MTIRQHWLVKTKLSDPPEMPSKSQFEKKFKISILRSFQLTDQLTNCLMPSDVRNSITAKTIGLIFLLLDIASFLDLPFAMLLYMQCILHGLTMALLCIPFIFAHHKKVPILW